MRISVEQFLGIAPKISEKLLGNALAQVAENAKLWSESLRSFAGLGVGEALNKPTGDIQTIFRYSGNSVWLAWTQDVNAVRGPIAGDTLEKTYFTGTDKPRVTTNTLWDDGAPGTFLPPASYILGIPAPVGPPVASISGAGNITATSAWVYTFVRKWGDGTVDEGPPSPPSNTLTLAAQAADVTVPTGAVVPGDYGITHKRLYRTNGAQFFFVSEVVVATTTTNDNVATANLGDAIESVAYNAPPDGMIGLIALPNGVMAAFIGNTVCLSEPYRPWAWPERNKYTVNWNIVGIGSVGTSIVVVTTAYPFIGRGVDPAQYSFKRHPGLFPGLSKRSVVTAEIGVLWASATGVAISDGAGVTSATKEFLSAEEWQRDFAPETMHATVHDGRYFAWFTTGVSDDGTKVGGGIILDRSEKAFLTTLSDYAYAAYAIPDTDELWLAKRNPLAANANYVFMWEADTTLPITFRWKSKLFITNGLENFAFAKILGDYGAGLSAEEIAAIEAAIAAVIAFNQAAGDTLGEINDLEINEDEINGDGDVLQEALVLAEQLGVIHFRYWVDDVLVHTQDSWNNRPFPLPAGFCGEQHEFEVEGTVGVISVALSTSMEELAAQ